MLWPTLLVQLIRSAPEGANLARMNNPERAEGMVKKMVIRLGKTFYNLSHVTVICYKIAIFVTYYRFRKGLNLSPTSSREYIPDSNWFCYALLRAGISNHFVVDVPGSFPNVNLYPAWHRCF
jgi:hypothetical protein